VTSTGKPFVNPELHSLGEAIIGADRGMTSGTWWADVLRARGLFVQASDGKRLGYAEDLFRQSAAAVYRAPDGNIYAFAGGLERFGRSTSFRFFSSDGVVYFNGIPVREYMLQTKFDETGATNPPGNDFENYGAWSNQGSYADIDLDNSGVPALDGHRWKIVNVQTGQVMEVADAGIGDGALIRSATDVNAPNQKWNIVRTRNGYFQLFNANSGRTAEVALGSLDNTASVHQWGTADNQIQQWYIEEAGSGSFYIRNGNSNKYLTSNATNSFQFDQTTSNLQKWRFVPAYVTAGPRAHYNFQGNVNSSTGSNNASATGSPTYVSGPAGQGQAINFDGVDDFVTLPNGVANSSDITVSALVKWSGGNAWQRIFDFGNGTASYMFLTPLSGANTMRFAITTASNANEQFLDTAPLPAGQWVHLALTLGGNTGVLYVDGKPRVAGQIFLNPSHINAALNYIGKSQWPDPLFRGVIDDFRIYDYALAQSQVANLVPNRWSGALNSSWTTATLSDPKNWQVMHSTAQTDYTDGNTVLFDDSAVNFTVNIADATVSPASVVFDNSTHDYVLNGPGGIAGTGALTKSGSRALLINSANTYTGGTTVNNGTLIANRLSNGTLTINGGVARITAKAVANDPTGTTVVPAINIAGGGALDLTNNSMVIDYAGSVGTLVDDTRTRLASGLITSTLADATHAVGYADNNLLGMSSVGGVSVDSSSFLLKFTYFGDANLDARVDVSDLGALATNWQASGVWTGGDFDYSGTVDVNDLGLLASNWQLGVGSPLGPSLQQALAALGLEMAAVPEPFAAHLLVLGAAGLLSRRRR
jgi:autotransporter-associated beta strand protein